MLMILLKIGNICFLLSLFFAEKPKRLAMESGCDQLVLIFSFLEFYDTKDNSSLAPMGATTM
jgi:hypothetical protein